MAGWIYIIVGAFAGAAITTAIFLSMRWHAKGITGRFLAESEQSRREEFERVVDQIKTAFAALSRDALSTNTDDFLKLASTKLDQQVVVGDQMLDGKKKLIDARLTEIDAKLGSLTNLLHETSSTNARDSGSVRGQLEKITQETNRLHDATAQLRDALANPQRRGRWGERMAEDVLRLAGFAENISYFKQQMLGDGSKPDFTFPLPGGQRVHMDVKFPLVNYLRVLDAPDESTRDMHTASFLADVRKRLKEVTTRSYIDPAAGTVECVLVFIPNEQIYGFIHEHDSALLDDALESKVVLCSPFSLYAVLSIIRQGMDNFRFVENSRQILDMVAEFRKQWTRYVEAMEKMGDKLDGASKAYDELTRTRTRALDRQLDKIDDLMQAREGQPAVLPGEIISKPMDNASRNGESAPIHAVAPASKR